MDALAYAGQALPLSRAGVDEAADQLGVDLATLWAVLGVETSGCGFLADRRPRLLFERHVFHRLTAGRFAQVAPDLSSARRGGYETELGGAWQYARLARAEQLERSAALASCSWGLAQIMGFNALAAGFHDAQDMARAFAVSEDAQLQAFVTFLQRRALAATLARRDWHTFALRYNGPAQASQGTAGTAGNYAARLASWHARYAAGPLPDVSVRAVQLALAFCGDLNVREVDGVMGPRTAKALSEWQRRQGRAATGHVDEATRRGLWSAAGWVAA